MLWCLRYQPLLSLIQTMCLEHCSRCTRLIFLYVLTACLAREQCSTDNVCIARTRKSCFWLIYWCVPCTSRYHTYYSYITRNLTTLQTLTDNSNWKKNSFNRLCCLSSIHFSSQILTSKHEFYEKDRQKLTSNQLQHCGR